MDLALQRTYHSPESNAFAQIQRKQTQKGSNSTKWNVLRIQSDNFPSALVDLLLAQIIYLGYETDLFCAFSCFQNKNVVEHVVWLSLLGSELVF